MPTTVPTLPAAPSDRSDQATYNAIANAWAAALDPWTVAINTVAGEVNTLATTATTQAATATTQAGLAAGQATNAANSAIAAAASVATVGTAWVSGTTYAVGDVRYSLINFASYRRQIAGAGTTDPKNDTTNWAPAVATTAPGLILLATLTPTAAANVDFLSTFSSTYNAYLVLGEGLCPSANDQLRFQFAVAGAADSGSNYYVSTVGTPATSSTTAGTGTGNTGTAGKGASFQMTIQNANDATSNIKSAIVSCLVENNTASNFAHESRGIAYVAANAISGIRFFWNSASNFKAQGKVRVYGISNT